MHVIARQRENYVLRSLLVFRQSLTVRQDAVIPHKNRRQPCLPPVRTCPRKSASWPDGVLARDSCRLPLIAAMLRFPCASVRHARYYWLMLAEGHLTRGRFAAMLRRIALLPLQAG